MKVFLTAIMISGIAFTSCKKSGTDSTPPAPGKTLPTVTTGTVTNITATSATCSATVTSTGNDYLDKRGFTWAITPNHAYGGGPFGGLCADPNFPSAGSYSLPITALQPHTTYYIKAYAQNSVGMSFGQEIIFTTP